GTSYLNEFVMTTVDKVDDIMAASVAAGILPGVKLGDHEIMIAVTEMQSRADLDRYVEVISSLSGDVKDN
ncbi:MAG: hypothetical protein K2L31_06890, partial [Muribaculum sp.]|nr:hypothetical protein [Muribaculum sp.]